MKLYRFLWLIIPVFTFSIWLVLPGRTQANLTNQIDNPAPTPIPGIPPGVEEILQTHFPGIILGIGVIVLIILAGVLIKPKR